MGVCRSWGIVSSRSFRRNEILCGSVIFVCSGNRSILDLDRVNPLCSTYGSLRWFFKLISGVGQDGGVSFVGALCPLVRLV